MTARVVAAAFTVAGVGVLAACAASPSHGAVVARRPGAVIVVAPNGAASGDGSVGAPLSSVQQAVNRLSRAGGRVELRAGVYHQRVTVRGAAGVTITAYRAEHAQLSGVGLTPPAGLSALVEISNSRRITISDLDLTGYRTTRKNVTPVGIYVHGHDEQVRLLDNHVHDLGTDSNTLGSFDANAHGIAVYGDDPRAPVTGLQVRGNEVDNLLLGASESVVVNGNVTNWAILDNRIHDNDNIGIDAIGYEQTLPPVFRYTRLNRARNGVIAGNDVSRIRSRGNPAYWDDGEWCNCADGIYVDGGTHIRIENNHVTDNDIGIEVAAENARGDADHVDVRRNTISGSLFTGIATGGYCDGHEDCGGVNTGASYDNVFTENTLRGNNRLDDGSPELLIQYHAWGDTFERNAIYAGNSGHAIYGTVPRFRIERGRPRNHSDDNQFQACGASPADMRFGWEGRTYVGAARYRAATGQDLRSAFR